MKWYSGSSEEYFRNGPFDTRDEAVDALDGEGGFVIEAEVYPIELSADRLLDHQYFEADDLFDYEHGEPDRKGNFAEADAELQQLLNAWLDKWRDTFVQPNMFCRHSAAEYIEPYPEVCPICQGDCSSANPPVMGCPMQ